MKNIEKYRDELLIAIEESSVCIFAKKRGIPVDNCIKHKCVLCKETLVDWLLEEYKPQIDWSKVPVDTPILVNMGNYEIPQHFCSVAGSNLSYFPDGKTSWSIRYPDRLYYATLNTVRLALPEDIEKYSI